MVLTVFCSAIHHFILGRGRLSFLPYTWEAFLHLGEQAGTRLRGKLSSYQGVGKRQTPSLPPLSGLEGVYPAGHSRHACTVTLSHWWKKNWAQSREGPPLPPLSVCRQASQTLVMFLCTFARHLTDSGRDMCVLVAGDRDRTYVTDRLQIHATYIVHMHQRGITCHRH